MAEKTTDITKPAPGQPTREVHLQIPTEVENACIALVEDYAKKAHPGVMKVTAGVRIAARVIMPG